MLTSLRPVDFSNLGDETLHVGPLTVIVGANASGKSHLRHAFRFLHGIGRGYTVSEIIGGKSGAKPLACEQANDRGVSAYAASDGTLRFVAMLAGLIGTETGRPNVFEENDNGIHPSRRRLLLDLIAGQTAKGKIQLVTTTHSPDLLSLVGEKAFQNTFVVCRFEQTDDAVIRRVNEFPNADKIRLTQGFGRLHFEVVADRQGLGDHPGGGRKALAEEASHSRGVSRPKSRLASRNTARVWMVRPRTQRSGLFRVSCG